MNRLARLKIIEDKKAHRLKLLLQDSKKKHDKCEKLIKDDIENKVDAACKHRAREELALKGHVSMMVKLDKESFRTYTRNLKQMKELVRNPNSYKDIGGYNTITGTRRTMRSS